ncbi:MAG TPA: hypothetical protein VLI67_02200 [Vicinamibacteria bacterium]|nr:hypothetical protein [Vicinamibacteria bacterium]
MTPTPCALAVGFLLPHPCPNAAVGPCARCGRSVCERHAGTAEAGLLCKVCETGSEVPPLLAGALEAAGLAASGLAAAGLAGAALSFFQPSDVAAFEAAGLEGETDEERFADLS